jgi:hypothetical protein
MLLLPKTAKKSSVANITKKTAKKFEVIITQNGELIQDGIKISLQNLSVVRFKKNVRTIVI